MLSTDLRVSDYLLGFFMALASDNLLRIFLRVGYCGVGRPLGEDQDLSCLIHSRSRLRLLLGTWLHGLARSCRVDALDH